MPRKFFKQGAKLSKEFWLTAAPLFASPDFLGLAYFDVLPPLIGKESLLGDVLSLLSVFFSTTSILLLGMSIGTHRIPLHMFHDQMDKRVSHLVTYGPYRYIRHPIYSSYLFALFAALLFCPQVGTLACFIYASIVLGKTAKQEEQRLSESPEFGGEYREYMKNSGRFLPPLSAIRLVNQDEEDRTTGGGNGSAGRTSEAVGVDIQR